MLEELKEIVERRTRERPRLDILRERFGPHWTSNRPVDTLQVAMAYCRLALPLLDTHDRSVAAQGADLLLRFIADMPAALAQQIADVPAFREPVERAWQEPCVDSFVALSCTVHDVWAHLVGPESEEDDAVLAEILRHDAASVIDFGAGAGHFSHALALHGMNVDAVEIDPVKAAFLEFRARHSGLSERLHLGARGRKDYDLALAINVLDHLEEPVLAVTHLAERLRPGGTLCVLAAFPSDGWHQSDRESVARCAELLWQRFVPAAPGAANVPWLECFVRRADRGADASVSQRVPCLHPRARLQAGSDGECVLATDNFYSAACTLNEDAGALCERFDGAHTVDEIAKAMDVEAEDLIAFCDYLHGRHQLYWAEVASGHRGRFVPLESTPC